MTAGRLDRQLSFLVAADAAKSLTRAHALMDGSRRENAAEQAWHFALWTLVFFGGAEDPAEETLDLLLPALLAPLPGLPGDPLSLLPDDQAKALRGADDSATWPARACALAQPVFAELGNPGLGAVERDLLTAEIDTGPFAALRTDWPALHARAAALLAGTAPAPAPDLDARLRFLAEADALKGVLRATPVFSGNRRENSAEHSWHLCLFAVILADHAVAPVSLGRVLTMLVLHDLVEIDAGDAPIHGDHDPAAMARKEAAAADRLFGLLPEPQGAALRGIWEEFEAAETADAVFAKAVDRVQPVLANLQTGGGNWPEYGVTPAQLDARVGTKVRRGAPALWSALAPRIDAWFAGAGTRDIRSLT